MLLIPGGDCRPGAPCDQPPGVWGVVLLVFLGLLLVWFIICIAGMWVAHGWCTIPGVAALTVFTPGWALDVTALQPTRANIQITGSESGAPITTLSEFHSDEPVFGVQARGTGRFPIRRLRFLNSRGTGRYDREHVVEVRARAWEWENVALPVDLAVPSSLMPRVVREGIRDPKASRDEGWSDGWRRYGRPAPPVQYRSPTPRFDQ